MLKSCSNLHCQQENPQDISNFNKAKKSKDGFQYWCRKCQREDSKKEHHKERKRKYNLSEKGKEVKRKANKKFNQSENGKKCYEKYRRSERGKVNRRRWFNEKTKNDICFRIRKNISRRICERLNFNFLSKNKSSILDFLPYSIQQLKEHLENQWEFWMNWNNYGVYEKGKQKWNIDHIIPHSLFYYESMGCEEFKKCWALENLRPLEVIENFAKGDKLL